MLLNELVEGDSVLKNGALLPEELTVLCTVDKLHLCATGNVHVHHVCRPSSAISGTTVTMDISEVSQFQRVESILACIVWGGNDCPVYRSVLFQPVVHFPSQGSFFLWPAYTCQYMVHVTGMCTVSRMRLICLLTFLAAVMNVVSSIHQLLYSLLPIHVLSVNFFYTNRQ